MKDYSINSEFVVRLDEKIQSLIAKGVATQDDEVFNELALMEFELQYHSIKAYRELCDNQGVTPDNVRSWDEIPAGPSELFKKTLVAAFPLSETELTIMTSGTSNPNAPSKIFRDKRCVDMYYRANAVMTKEYLFPDVDRMKLLLMVPSPKVAPSMGMAIGLEQLRQNFGTQDSRYLISPAGMEWELLFSALHEAEEAGEPVAIVGATSGLVFLFNFCQEHGLSFQLPPGSRICDGGGYLGTFGECSREHYLELCAKVMGVPAEFCVNTLGSGESTTNYFDNVLRNHWLGKTGIPRYKECPPWTRTIVVDPRTGRRLPKGEVGLIRHYDLVNRANLLVVQTNNLGYEIEDGFEIIGRADARDKGTTTFLNRMISGLETCSTVADGMLVEGQSCSTVADGMLAEGQSCSTVADRMLAEGQSCSTVADDMLARSPHGGKFANIPPERLEKLKKMCPFLQLKGLLNKKSR